MRRIETPEEKERRRKRITAILSILMLLLLVISTLGYAFLSNTNSGNKNQNPQTQGTPLPTDKINIQYQGLNFNLVSTLNNIKDVPVDISITPISYSGKILYIDAENSLLLQEIGSTIGRFSSRTQQACYGSFDKNLPEKKCTDNLIVVRESKENKVSQQDNCIFIDGDIRAVDAFIYKLYNNINS